LEEKFGSKYGKVEATMSTLPIAVAGMLIVGICFLIAVAAQIYFAVSKGSLSVVALIVCCVAAVALLGYSIYTLAQCKVYLFEKGIVAVHVGKVEEMPIEDITCILWDFPGAAQGNDKGPRKNVTTAEVIFRGHRKSFKMSDGYYDNVETNVGNWQAAHKIPREL
jgi:hypothetical protein